VSALDEFDDVQAVESCEEHNGTPVFVYFIHRHSTQQTFAFVRMLLRLLGPRLESCCDYKLRLEWTPGTKQPLAEIITHRAYLSTLADALADNAAKTCRTSVSAGGR